MDKGFLLEPPVTRWICHLCGKRDVTREHNIHTRFHGCAAIGGLTAPMHDETLNIKVEVSEREDYIGNEEVQTDDEGRPVMNVTTTRDDGEDIVVFAPTVRGEFR